MNRVITSYKYSGLSLSLRALLLSLVQKSWKK